MNNFQNQLTYSEDKNFYASLDNLVKEKKEVEILCQLKDLNRNTGLRKRLQNCSNWKEIESQTPEVCKGVGVDIPIRSFEFDPILDPIRVVIAIAKNAIVASIAGLVFYASYKTCEVDLDIEMSDSINTGKVKIKLHPCES